MTPEEQKEFAGKLASQVNEAFAAKEAGMMKDVQKIVDELKAKMPTTEMFADFQKQLDNITVTVKKIDFEADAKKSIGDQIKEALSSSEFKTAAKLVKESGHAERPFVLSLKVGDMTEAGNLTGTVIPPLWIPGVSQAPYRLPFLRDIITQLATESSTIYWIEETARTDGSSFKAEASAYDQGDQTLRQYSIPVERVAEYQTVSDEMLTDIPYLQSLMSGKLMTDLNLKIDYEILAGSGTPPHLKGWDQYVTAYAAPAAFALDIVKPNYLDLLMAGIAQVENAKSTPSHVLLNPSDAKKLKMQKTDDGAYVNPEFIGNGAMFVDGIPIVTNLGIPQGYFYVADAKKSNFAMRKEIEIRLWDQVGTNPIYGLKTITAVARCAHWITGQDTSAFVYGALSQANLNALAKP